MMNLTEMDIGEKLKHLRIRGRSDEVERKRGWRQEEKTELLVTLKCECECCPLWKGTGQTQSVGLNTDFSADRNFHHDISDVSVLSQISDPIQGSKLIAGPFQVNTTDWQEINEAVIPTGSGITNSHYESVVSKTDSLASGEALYHCV